MSETPIYDAVSRNMALAIEAGDLKGRILALQNVVATIDAMPDHQLTRANLNNVLTRLLADHRKLKAVNTRKRKVKEN